MNAIAIKKQLIDLVEEKMKLVYEIDFVDQTNFFMTGLIDSIEYLGLITAIEESFNLHFTDADIASQAFDTVESIHALILEKTQAEKA